jgi:hypothetical protein
LIVEKVSIVPVSQFNQGNPPLFINSLLSYLIELVPLASSMVLFCQSIDEVGVESVRILLSQSTEATLFISLSFLVSTSID